MKINLRACRTVVSDKVFKFSQVEQENKDIWNEGSSFVYYSRPKKVDRSDAAIDQLDEYRGHLFLGRIFLKKHNNYPYLSNTKNGCLTNSEFEEFLENSNWRVGGRSKVVTTTLMWLNYTAFIESLKAISLVAVDGSRIYTKGKQSISFEFTAAAACVGQISYYF